MPECSHPLCYCYTVQCRYLVCHLFPMSMWGVGVIIEKLRCHQLALTCPLSLSLSLFLSLSLSLSLSFAPSLSPSLLSFSLSASHTHTQRPHSAEESDERECWPVCAHHRTAMGVSPAHSNKHTFTHWAVCAKHTLSQPGLPALSEHAGTTEQYYVRDSVCHLQP